MSNRYKGGIISATPPTTNGPFEDGAASGAWTLEQQMQAAAAGTWPLAGNVGPDAFIENLFQTWLYAGNDSTQTITNGIDLAGEGGMVWIKGRDIATEPVTIDTARGVNKNLKTDATSAQNSDPSISSFNSNGFSINSIYSFINDTGYNYASWTFRKQPKFFDVVTYTGNGSTQTINHNLGSVPGFIICKSTTSARNWLVYHRSIGETQFLQLDTTIAATTASTPWNNTAPTSTTFTVGSSLAGNESGQTFVAYVFAHNAGGFGLTGTDNVISCGSFTTDGSGNASVTLGYEPQWIITKQTDAANSWYMEDVMRNMSNTGYNLLQANSSAAEIVNASATLTTPTATGFTETNQNPSSTFIYIAIRRGPMAVPTTGTSVFTPVTYTGNGSTSSGQLVTAGFPVDMGINRYNRGGAGDWDIVDRLRGLTSIGVSPNSRYLNPHNTNAEASGGYIFDATNTSVDNYGFSSSFTQLNYLFQRAPGFFDEVCYTGDGAAPQTTPHNLGVAADLMIVKRRNSTGDWGVYYSSSGVLNPNLILNSTAATGATYTDTLFATAVNVLAVSPFNISGATYVAYLFASCPGVSKVGSYTGTGTTQIINCGFTAGSRFVLIKRTDSTGDWYVWDSARGIVAGDDPYLLLNSTAAEVTNTDYVDTAATGFEITSTAPAAINASGGTFVFLAIA